VGTGVIVRILCTLFSELWNILVSLVIGCFKAAAVIAGIAILAQVVGSVFGLSFVSLLDISGGLLP
jgi:hypothetical protein